MPGQTTGERIHGYLRPEAFTRRMERTAEQAAARAQVTTIGSSVERRDLRAVIVAAPERRPDRRRPQAAVIAGVHGAEAVGTELALRLLEMACATRPTGPVADLLEVADLVVVPCANPDGRARAMHALEQPRAWRPVGQSNANGVDLARNWPAADGAPAPRSWPDRLAGVRGPRSDAPLSEPETRAVDGFLGDRRPFATLDLHAPGGSLSHPAASPARADADVEVLRAIVAAFVANQGSRRYRVDSRAELTSAGRMLDHLYRRDGTLGVTVKVGEALPRHHPRAMRSAFWRRNPLDLEATLANDADACFSALRAGWRPPD